MHLLYAASSADGLVLQLFGYMPMCKCPIVHTSMRFCASGQLTWLLLYPVEQYVRHYEGNTCTTAAVYCIMQQEQESSQDITLRMGGKSSSSYTMMCLMPGGTGVAVNLCEYVCVICVL